jgi:phosphoserine aminotransferase
MNVWEQFWQNQEKFNLDFLIADSQLRLPTVLALTGPPQQVENIQILCGAHDIELGKGYGEWKNNSIRIANFPSHTLADIEKLIQILT